MYEKEKNRSTIIKYIKYVVVIIRIDEKKI